MNVMGFPASKPSAIRGRSSSIHASVGVIIAIVANTWTGRIVSPFIWGVIWCARLALLPSESSSSPAEYLRAVIESLIPALLIGALKALFRYLVLG